jgi:hypothetical protein
MSTERDPAFGEVKIRIDSESGLVDVRGPAIPAASLQRGTGPGTDAGSRIGSRDQRDLCLLVGGAEARIAPAPGRLSRRSYRVDALVNGVRFRLVPDAPSRSALYRDGRRLGRFWADDSGGVGAEWSDGRVAPDGWGLEIRRRDRQEVEPLDAAVGYLLAAAYGTGAPARWEVLLRALLS